jgi:drug/metabolite transporter (DMT)-like permease
LLSISVVVLAIYALSWQQIIKRMPIGDAYMFKGTSIVFVLLLSVWLFEDIITWQNIVGSIIIILGIALFAKADKEAEA